MHTVHIFASSRRLMMTRCVCVMSSMLFVSAAPNICAQTLDEAVDAHNEERIERRKKAAVVLMGWGVTNAAASLTGYSVSDDEQWGAFHQMNGAVNIAHIAIGAITYTSLRKRDSRGLGLAYTLSTSFGSSRTLAFNVGFNLNRVYAEKRSSSMS